jgi:hypothetical protein
MIFFGVIMMTGARADTEWNGIWFECEFAARTAPPADDCAMLDDDGFIFSDDNVTYVKVIDSPETDTCKKQRHGQCFRAEQPAITVITNRTGQVKFTPATLQIHFFGCTQIYHTTSLGDYVEARPDANRCYWAGKKHFYLRRFEGEVRRDG